MPALNLTTNVKIDDPKAFVQEFSKVSSEILGKPEIRFSVMVSYNETLIFAGTFEPAISLRIDSLDNINPEANEKYSKEFFDFFQNRLGVPPNRGYITFNDPGRENLGYNSTTIATILGAK